LPTDINKSSNIFKNFLNDVKYNNENKEIIIKIFFILKSIKFYGNKKTIIYTTSIDDCK